MARNILPGWRNLPTQIELGFRARAVGTDKKKFSVLVMANHGAGSTTPSAVVAYSETFADSVWREHTLPIDLKPEMEKTLGDVNTESLRLSVILDPEGGDTGVELTDFIVRAVEVEEPNERIEMVQVGHRQIPAKAFQKLRNTILQRVYAAREGGLVLYSLKVLTGEKLSLSQFPAGVEVTGGFVKLTLPADPPEPVYLNVYCTQEPISLDNPNCYHSFHIYAR